MSLLQEITLYGNSLCSNWTVTDDSALLRISILLPSTDGVTWCCRSLFLVPLFIFSQRISVVFKILADISHERVTCCGCRGHWSPSEIFCGPHPTVFFLFICMTISVNVCWEVSLFSASSRELCEKCSHGLLVGFSSRANWMLCRKQFKLYSRVGLKDHLGTWSSRHPCLVGFDGLFNMLSHTCLKFLSVLASHGLWGHCVPVTVPFHRSWTCIFWWHV